MIGLTGCVLVLEMAERPFAERDVLEKYLKGAAFGKHGSNGIWFENVHQKLFHRGYCYWRQEVKVRLKGRIAQAFKPWDGPTR